MSGSKPIEVAVIGGGCGSISAAFELTRPEHNGKYHVTIYQLGWRLGGKGASGRGPADRVEEHGLHMWLGCYENAFRLMRECYAELGRDPRKCRTADWRDAFAPETYVGVMETPHDRAWAHWLAYFPPEKGLPGDALTDNNPFSVTGYMLRSLNLLGTLLLAAARRRGEPGANDERFTRIETGSPLPSPGEVLAAVNRLVKYGILATTAGLIEAISLLETVLKGIGGYPNNVVAQLMEAVVAGARRQIEWMTDGDDEMRRLWELIDLMLAVVTGIVRFGLINAPNGFEKIDDYECRQWLRLNGASERSLNSAMMVGLYDLALAYEDGDFARPGLAAGQALRGVFRMFFTYRGALFWKMRAGMGDIVFAPFYEVLRRRGVSFMFFHRLENVRLADAAKLAPGEPPYVEALEFDVQAEVKGAGEYSPLVDVRGLPCWPSTPIYDQLVEGERFQREGWNFESHWDRRKVASRTLRVVDDFDFVVLGVSLGTIPFVCREILARDKRWRDMVERVKTVATQSVQLWMREDMETLGWNEPPSSIAAFVHPFDTWADMRQLIPEENWPVRPRALAYFCSVLAEPPKPLNEFDDSYLARCRGQVRLNAIRFLNRDIGHLWPGAIGSSGEFRWELLMDPREGAAPAAEAATGEARFDSQFWMANVNPSDRYVLCLPKTPKYRISPLDNTYDNLTIAGDWTDCGFNEGCVEVAVISGRLAAHAISLSPKLKDIIGYDHP